jgi:hypothetical protein
MANCNPNQIDYIPNNWFNKTVMDKENPNEKNQQFGAEIALSKRRERG